MTRRATRHAITDPIPAAAFEAVSRISDLIARFDLIAVFSDCFYYAMER